MKWDFSSPSLFFETQEGAWSRERGNALSLFPQTNPKWDESLINLELNVKLDMEGPQVPPVCLEP
jgi:hypothetical protein